MKKAGAVIILNGLLLTIHAAVSLLQIKSNFLSFKRFYLLLILILMFSIAGNATIYYVSSSGNDSNSGTSPNQPWKSLAKVNNFSPQQGDQILFNRGDEWIGTITVSASGTSGNPVIYGAYGTGPKPKIYGSEEITGWSLHSGYIYKANVDSTIEQLFIDNSRARLARYPNSGYFTTTNVHNDTQFTSKDLKPGINYTGATWIGRTSAFTMFSKNVTASNAKTLTLESSPSYGLGVNKGFFLANKLEFLDQPGEWYYDASTKTVYFWTPNGGSPANYKVRGSTIKQGVDISDKNNIIIRDLEILHSSETGIYINRSNYISIENNRIISPDLYGIHMPINSKSPTYKNNYIYQAGGGIRCFGTSATITDNIIEDTGLHENINKTVFTHDNYGTAIYSRNNRPTIQYNRILNAGYDGINWKGTNGSIKYNYVNGACQVLDDGGGIYTYNYGDPTASARSEVMYNIVLNVHGNRVGYTDSYEPAYGIYMDNETTGVKVMYNTVSQVACGLYIHDAGNILLQYNTIFDALLGCRASGQYSVSYIYDNIFYSIDRKGDFTWWTNQHQKFQVRDGSTPLYDNNKYYHPNQTMVFIARTILKFAGWKSATRQDENSSFYISPLAEGETDKLFYNDTKQIKTINLGSSVYRDIDGKKFSGSFTLEPFTSKILIGTYPGDNQSPIILDQSFEFYAPKSANDLIGQVVANDPDNEQTLNYSIIQGNDADLFAINSATGKIYANWDIKSSMNQSIALVVKVTDNAISPSSATATVTLHVSTDIISPVISSFTIPSTYTSLTIPILTFTATDNLAVTGYKLTETPTAPAANDNGWETSAPAFYTFSQSGTKTLFAWTMDAAGNISKSVYRTVKLTEKINEYVTICEGGVYLGWTEAGVYERVETSQVITTYLTENPIQYSIEDIIITEGDDYMGWTESGIYERTLESVAGCDSIVTTNLTVSTIVSFRQTPKVNDLVLYPNPASSYINIEYVLQPEDTKIEILDGNGRTVYHQKAESVSAIRINTNHLHPGIYFLRSVQRQQLEVIKFIIQ